MNLRTKQGFTVLSVAVFQGNPEPIMLLIAKGADIKAKNNDGRTVPMLIAHRGKVELVNQLFTEEVIMMRLGRSTKSSSLRRPQVGAAIEVLYTEAGGNVGYKMKILDRQ